MPILKSALKQIRSDKRKRARNQAIVSDLKTRLRKFRLLVSEKKTKDLSSNLKTLISKIDKAANKGIIHKNKASRLISRLTKKTKRLGAA